MAILATIFTFIIITTYISEKEKTKRQKMKIQATLRSEEMARGYRPGTYSSAEGMEDEEESLNGGDVPHRMSREELEKGIADLDERLKNLDSIMKNKKN
ncbi:MAG: hypothetical protein ACI4S4_04890 [Candidatus Ornithospirochaeta sp.]